jgi:hypothetical protein
MPGRGLWVPRRPWFNPAPPQPHLHNVPAETNLSVGHLLLASQDSATSHGPAAALQETIDHAALHSTWAKPTH